MSNNEKPHFGQVLKRLRLSAGLSQEDLAERSGLSARAVSDLERGQRTLPRMETVRMLAEGLGLSTDERANLIAASRPELGIGSRASSSEFTADPAVSVAGAARRPLPIPPTRLVGREAEIAYLIDLLQRGDVRLVTLTGEGGVGKTRLCLATAAQLAGRFADGVAFVDLTVLSDPALVGAEIAAAAGVAISGERKVQETLCVALRDRNLLLVLDSFEHVLAASNVVSDLLSACSALKLLVTSRERLQLRGEHVVPVNPLEVPNAPNSWQDHGVPDLMTIPATRLFLERAKEVNFGFDLIKENPQTIADICRKLEGMPLAIELAAARTRTLPLSALLDRLDRPLPVLTSGPRDVPERQRTLRNTIAWSYDLLPVNEQALFQRMAVFSGGASIEAIGEVAAAAGPIELSALHGIESLLDKSLVREARNPAGTLRVSMLETIREFSAECLEASGIGNETRQAHALWFHDLARSAEQDLRLGIDQAHWFATIDRELGNIRVSMEWFQTIRDGVHLVQLATALDEYWFAHSLYREVLAWIRAGLAFEPDISDTVRGWALCTAASAARQLRDIPSATDYVAQAQIVAERSDDAFLLGRTMLAQAALHQVGEEWDAAARLCESAIPRFREAGAMNYLALMYVEIGHMRQLLGDPDEAARQIDEGLMLMRTTGDDWAVAMALEVRGHLAVSQGESQIAFERLTEAIRMGGAVGDDRTVLGAFIGLARLALEAGQPKLSARFLAAAEARAESGVGLPSLTRPHIEQTSNLARAALGEREFRAQWERGLRQPFAKSLAEAMAMTARSSK